MLTSGQVDSGQWLYPGDPLADDRAEVRFLCGDTQSTDQLLSDEEIGAALRISERSGRPGGTVSTTTLAVNGTTAAGETTLDLDATAVSGTLDRGDSFLIAGDPTRYYLTGPFTADVNAFTAVSFWPGLLTAATDNAVVTLRLGNTILAAAICCDTLASRFAREADITDNGRTVSYSQRSRAYAERAKVLRSQVGFGRPAAGSSATLVRC